MLEKDKKKYEINMTRKESATKYGKVRKTIEE